MARCASRSGQCPSGDKPLLIAIVDDDESVRESLPDLLEELGFAVEAFASAYEFLSFEQMNRVKCLLLDVSMPGMSGPELQQELVSRGVRIPIIFNTSRTDDSVRLVELGAAACLHKPFNEQQLLAVLDAALLRSPDSHHKLAGCSLRG